MGVEHAGRSGNGCWLPHSQSAGMRTALERGAPVGRGGAGKKKNKNRKGPEGVAPEESLARPEDQDDSAAQPANALRIDVPKAATPTTISSTTSSSILHLHIVDVVVGNRLHSAIGLAPAKGGNLQRRRNAPATMTAPHTGESRVQLGRFSGRPRHGEPNGLVAVEGQERPGRQIVGRLHHHGNELLPRQRGCGFGSRYVFARLVEDVVEQAGPTRPAAGSSASRSSPDGSCGREQTCAHGCVLRTHRPGTKWDRIAQAPRAETGTAGCPRRCAHELGPRRRAGVGLLQQSSIQDAVFHHRCQTTLVLQNGYIAGGVAVDQDQVGGCPLFQRTHHPGRVVGLAAVPGSAEQGLNWRHAEQVHVVLEVLCVGAMRGDAEAIVAADK
ncbi:hypothetical protein GQR58_030499 [Nymphon striatum]|nr:hypothetical protein GQR58_030499 [Nymphon striatum]